MHWTLHVLLIATQRPATRFLISVHSVSIALRCIFVKYLRARRLLSRCGLLLTGSSPTTSHQICFNSLWPTHKIQRMVARTSFGRWRARVSAASDTAQRLHQQARSEMIPYNMGKMVGTAIDREMKMLLIATIQTPFHKSFLQIRNTTSTLTLTLCSAHSLAFRTRAHTLKMTKTLSSLVEVTRAA